jgi:hypothetical protein
MLNLNLDSSMVQQFQKYYLIQMDGMWHVWDGWQALGETEFW